MRLRVASRGDSGDLLGVFLCLVLLLGDARAQQVPEGQIQFTSVVAGYIVDFPSDWHTFPPGDLPTLDIYNFPFSRAGGGVLPDGGASIALVPAPARITTIEDWVKADSLLSEQRSRSSMTLRRLYSGEPLRVTEVDSRISEGMASVACYFEIPGRLLVGRLIYWPGDPKAKEYREVLHGIIERIRPLAR